MFWYAIIISIKKLIDNLFIPNQLHADKFDPLTGAKLLNVFL